MKKAAVLFILFLVLPLYGQQLPSDFGSGEQSINDSWKQLDLNLSRLEESVLNLQSDNSRLTEILNEQERLLNDSQTASAELLKRLQTSESALQESEAIRRRWKTACEVSIGLTVPTIAVLAAILANR